MSFHDHRMPLLAAAHPAARRQLGPVTLAIRAMRSAYALAPKAPTRRTGPVTEAIRIMRAAVPDFDANPDLIALRRALANRIEADIAALDMLGGDPDLEADYTSVEHHPAGGHVTLGRSTDDEETLCGVGTHVGGSLNLWPAHDELEAGDDNGIADWQGQGEQVSRFLAMGGDLNAVSRWAR